MKKFPFPAQSACAGLTTELSLGAGGRRETTVKARGGGIDGDGGGGGGGGGVK